MRPSIPWLWVAGAIQLVVIAANFALPKKLRCRENLAKVSPMIREVFVVHWLYIVLVLGIFTTLCFWFAPELAGGSRLGRFLSLAMAIFWLWILVAYDAVFLTLSLWTFELVMTE